LVIAVLHAMNHRCRAATTVPDPGGELAAYLLRQAAAEGFEQVSLALSRACQHGETGAASLSTQIARVPVNVLHSELALARHRSQTGSSPKSSTKSFCH
jgi:hypothetical protein